MPVTLRFSHGGSLKVVQKPRPQESVDYWDALCRKVPPNGWKTRDPHQPYLGQHRESGRMRTRKDERKKDRARRGKRLGNSLNLIAQRLSPVQCERIEKKRGKESEDDRTLRCRESLQRLENARLSSIDPNLVSIESSVECGPVRKKKT
jgi:hypothetical protein